MDTGFPNVECERKATFGSNPNNLATRTHDLETFTNLLRSWVLNHF